MIFRQWKHIFGRHNYYCVFFFLIIIKEKMLVGIDNEIIVITDSIYSYYSLNNWTLTTGAIIWWISIFSKILNCSMLIQRIICRNSKNGFGFPVKKVFFAHSEEKNIFLSNIFALFIEKSNWNSEARINIWNNEFLVQFLRKN